MIAPVLLLVLLGILVQHLRIPPVVDSDYCYQLLAAKRLLAGEGLTSIPPAAPLQPWTWRADFGFLTQWPCGFALLVAGVATTLGVSVLDACSWLSIAACALALVGWFLWVRRCASRTITGTLVAAVAAGCAVSAEALINPSTDALMMAVLPFVLLCAARAVEQCRRGREEASVYRWIVLTGLSAGGLFWIRYASVFVPAAIGLAFVFEWRFRRSLRLAHVGLFAVAAMTPIAALLLINRAFGMDGSAQGQLNLGSGLGFDFSLSTLTETWRHFTDLGYYDHHAAVHWTFALWPFVLGAMALSMVRTRRAARSYLKNTEITISVTVVLCLLAMLVVATVLFGEKFNYIGLDRYYLPGRPLYFVLFVLPLLLVRARVLRVMTCGALVVAASWTLRQEWPRPLNRWQAESRQTTPLGQTALCFESQATELYGWLARHGGDDLIVISNFHEYIALETGLPALPVPTDRRELDRWIERISHARSVINPRVLFVLNPENKWRGYWIPDPPEIRRSFQLQSWPDAPPGLKGLVYAYSPTAS